MIRVCLILIALLGILLPYCEGDPCVLKETCSSCIRSMECAWCAAPTNDDSLVRCVNAEHKPANWCPEHIVNPQSSMTVLKDDALSAGSKNKDAVQIKPQNIQLTLRPGEEIRIPFQYQQAMSYPVDLYYLMDLSASMEDDRDKLSTLGSKLAYTMINMTNNFKIGFGSFVDKPEMPYTNTVPEKLKKPCNLKDGTPCAPTYSFKNHMPLTTETESFSREVKSAPVSGNLDYPEGGLDALMQVMVCTKEIGWRPRARKLVVFSTDAGYHMAGDGKLAGIVEPNDEKCHLSTSGAYTNDLNTDYPSIGQIAKMATENNINIIFATDSSQTDTYLKLKNSIPGASFGALTKDSANVVDLVKKEYNKLVDSISITDDSGSFVEIQYYSKCLTSEEKLTNECGGLKGRPVVNFTAIVKAINCPSNNSEWEQKINIRPGNFMESLSIDLKIICDCPCEQHGNSGFEKNSKSCNMSGDLQCGVCSCDSGRYGRFCECSGDEARTISGDTAHCRPDNSTDEICSGAGYCKCGKCDCDARSNPNEVTYGTYCECNNFSCNRYKGLLCAGPTHGHCTCGSCTCLSGWSGLACECRDTNATCIAPEKEDVCSGHGKCVCGECLCDLSDKLRYSGRYCEECPNCPHNRCDEISPCVECKVHGTGIHSVADCMIKCTALTIESVDQLNTPVNNDDLENTEQKCVLPDTTGCTLYFNYKYESSEKILKVWALKNKECPIEMWVVIVGVVGSTVLAGLIMLIIWKLLTSLHDKREYIKFEKERQMAKWDRGDNPLYKPSTTTFSNPTFRG